MAIGKLLLSASCASLLFLLFLQESDGQTKGKDQKGADDAAARKDRFGAALPNRALMRLGGRRLGVEGLVQSVAFSPDSKYVAGCDNCGQVYIWDLADGKVFRQFDADRMGPEVFFSQDGKTLVLRSPNGETRTWDIESGKQTDGFRRDDHAAYYAQMHFTPDQTRVICVDDINEQIVLHTGKPPYSTVTGSITVPIHYITVLDRSTGKATKRLAETTQTTVFVCSALSADGRLLAVSIRDIQTPTKLVRLLDVETGKVVREIHGEGEGWFLSMVFTSDGKTLALGSKDEILLADVATGKISNRLTDTMTTVGFLAFDKDGTSLVSHSHDNIVRLWDLKTKKVVTKVEAVPDGYQKVNVAQVGLPPEQTQEKFTRSICTAFSPDGKWLATGSYGTIQIHDIRTGKRVMYDESEPNVCGPVAFSPDGRSLLVSSTDKSISWDLTTGQARDFRQGTTCLSLSPNGKQLAFGRTQVKGDEPALAFLADVNNPKKELRLEHPQLHQFQFQQLAFGPGARTFLTLVNQQPDEVFAFETAIHRWDARTGKSLGSIRRDNLNRWPAALTPDGRLAVFDLSEGLQLVDVERDENLLVLKGSVPQQASGKPVFSYDDGYLFVYSNDSHVFLWEVASGPLVGRYYLDSEAKELLAKEFDKRLNSSVIHALAISYDGRFVATSEQFTYGFPIIRIWDAATAKEVQRLTGFGSPAQGLAFSADGKRLASSFRNGTALIWDVSSIADPKKNRDSKKPVEFDESWKELAAPDAAAAYRALTTIQVMDDAVDFLARRVSPAPAADVVRIRKLIKSLDSEEFEERDSATKELKKVGARYRGVLESALKDHPSLELKNRLETILAETSRKHSTETLRSLRAITILERIGSDEACNLLKSLAAGAPDAAETIAAHSALQRLSSRSEK